jgi:2',3'-cyclic-nucleotide 2'-phosphodiesterase (5'-nucleotidase family)
MRLLIAFLTLFVGVSSTAIATEPVTEIEAPISAASTTEALRVIWFGGTGGLSSQQRRRLAPTLLYECSGSSLKSFASVDEGPDAYALDGRIVLAESGLPIAAFRPFVAGPHKVETVDEKFPVLSSPYELVFQMPGETESVLELLEKPSDAGGIFSRKTGRLLRYVAPSGASAMVVELPGAVEGPLNPNPDAWELRFLFQGRAEFIAGGQASVMSVGRPFHEGGRRLEMIKGLESETPGQTLVLAGGEDIESFSFVAAREPDRQRPNTWKGYGLMGLDALTPGAAELAFGIDRLTDEAADSKVALLATNVQGDPLPGWRIFQRGRLKVLVIGILSPSLSASAKRRGLGDRTVGDPVVAVEQAVKAASKTLNGNRPDLVIALGNLTPTENARLIRESSDLDFVLSDFGERDVYSERSQQLQLHGKRIGESHQAYQIIEPGDARLGLMDLVFEQTSAGGGFRLRSIDSKTLPVHGDMARDSTIAIPINSVRQAAYGPAQVVLLPDLGAVIDGDDELRKHFESEPRIKRFAAKGVRTPGQLTAQLWRRLVVRALREGFSAQAAFVPRFDYPWSLAGPITRLAAAANMGLPDRVVRTTLSARALGALLKSPAMVDFVSSGIDVPGRLLRGRKLNDREVYTVVLTDGLLEDPRLKGILSNNVQRRFRRTDEGFVADDGGEGVTVRSAVMEVLGGLGARKAPTVTQWLKPDGKKIAARWFLDLDTISLEANRYSVTGEQNSYQDVRETRVTTGSNSRLGGRGVIGIGREGKELTWVNRLGLAFDKAWYDDLDDEQETADSIEFSTELQIPAWRLQSTGLVPYASGAFLTEFTPTEGETGLNPRKKQVDGAIGLLRKGKTLRIGRLGAVVTHDLASEIPDPQLGLLGAIDLRYKRPSTVWRLDLEGRYYVPGVGREDPSELGIILRGRGGVDVPVRGRLSLGLYVDLFAYRGQVEETRSPGASILSGIALKYDERITLGYW